MIAITPALTERAAKAVLRTGVNAIVMRPLSPSLMFSYLQHAMNSKRLFITSPEYFGPVPAAADHDPYVFVRALKEDRSPVDPTAPSR